jgi:hypothetical protein
MQTRLYRIWHNMKTRCNYPGKQNYKYYGGRGIRVCDEWSDSFKAFEAWALANGYADNLTLDRKDNDGNYEPGNCRFITHAEQQQNKRRMGLHIIEYRSESHSVTEWAEIFGIKQKTMFRRLELGWSMERIEATP